MFTSLANFRIEPLGEFALVIKPESDAAGLAEFLESLALPGVIDVVPAFDDVALYFSDLTMRLDELRVHLEAFQHSGHSGSQHHQIPVCYEMGSDLATVCESLDVSQESFVQAHTQSVYSCKAVGFCPGFAYLGWLPDEIANLGRKPTPQLRVPVGSVAIVGRMTAVYPLEKPGGWWLIGRTPLIVVNPQEDYFPISVGDTVSFTLISPDEFKSLEGQKL